MWLSTDCPWSARGERGREARGNSHNILALYRKKKPVVLKVEFPRVLPPFFSSLCFMHLSVVLISSQKKARHELCHMV